MSLQMSSLPSWVLRMSLQMSSLPSALRRALLQLITAVLRLIRHMFGACTADFVATTLIQSNVVRDYQVCKAV